QQVVGGHTAVDLDRGQLDAGVLGHGVDDLAGLPGGGLQHGTGDVRLGDVAGQAGDDATGVGAPVRGEQTGEGRHEVGAAVVVHRQGERLDLGGALDQAHLVAHPLHQRTGDGDGAFEGVDRLL